LAEGELLFPGLIKEAEGGLLGGVRRASFFLLDYSQMSSSLFSSIELQLLISMGSVETSS
jgi:hypothetical protein